MVTMYTGAVRKQVEIEVFVPVYKQLMQTLRREDTAGGEQEKRLKECLVLAKVSPFSLPTHGSSSFWLEK